MTTFMRATQPYWLGDKFIAAGVLRPKGHPDVVDAFCEEIEIEDLPPKPEPKQTKGKSAS